MKAILTRIFITHWPRKLVAFLSAIVIWFLVNQSMTVTKTFSDVNVRITHLAPQKTVIGLLPTGLLSRKITVTITGTKSLINTLSSNDLEVVINAEGKKESWIEHIGKKNLTAINGEWEFKKEINDVTANDLFIQLSQLITEDIPLTILQPIGEPPQGYQFLNVWPKYLMQKVTGPEEKVKALKEKGLEVSFNLDKITKKDLDSLKTPHSNSRLDEISYMVPESWKQVAIAFQENALVPFNDPKADLLRIDFLKQEMLTLGISLPVSVFFPLKYSKFLNPHTYTLENGDLIEDKNGLKLFKPKLYVKGVSHLFLEVVKDYLELTITAYPKTVQNPLDWSLTFINLKELEEAYIAKFLKIAENELEYQRHYLNIDYLHSRFQNYLNEFELYIDEQSPLQLKATVETNTISIELET